MNPNKRAQMELLTDTYGLSYKMAYDVVHHPDKENILTYLQVTYKQGLQDRDGQKEKGRLF